MIRGTWLVLLELTFFRLAWTFNIDFTHYMLAGVIWMLGWCMILMALLVQLPVTVNAIVGVVVIAGHNLVALMIGESRQSLLHGSLGGMWRILYFGGGIATDVGGGGPNFWVLYSIVPWIGVMAAGYAFGAVFCMSPLRRRVICNTVGGGAIAAFVIVQCLYIYGERRPVSDSQVPIWMTFLTATKYPASLTISADDARTHDRGDSLARAGEWPHGAMAGGVRARAVFFLPAPYPAHPWRGRGDFSGAFARGDELALWQPSGRSGHAARRIYLEPRPALPGYRGGGGRALFPVSMVRAAQIPSQGRVAVVLVESEYGGRMSSADPPLESEPTIGAPVSRHLSVANLGRSIVFYRDMLGFDVRPLNEGEGGGAVAEALRGPARIQFTTQPGAFDSTDAARPRGSAMVFFQANDVAAMREFIVARGGTPRELEKVDFVPVSVEVRPHCSAQVPANTGSQTQTRVLDMDQ